MSWCHHFTSLNEVWKAYFPLWLPVYSCLKYFLCIYLEPHQLLQLANMIQNTCEEKWKPMVFTHILLTVSFFDVPRFILLPLPFCLEEIFFDYSFKAGLLVANSLCFPSAWKCLDFPFNSKGYFHWVLDTRLTVLFFQDLKILRSFPLVSRFLVREALLPEPLLLCGVGVVFLWLLPRLGRLLCLPF